MVGTATTPLWKRMRRMRPSADTLLRTFRITRPAVDVEVLARAMGIDVRFVRWAPHHGRVEIDGDRAVIEVPTFGQVPFRRRFTIAHELGHLMMHDVDEAFRSTGSDWFSTDPLEVEANQYAADLLMPLWMLEPVAMSFGPDVPRLARMFQVSEQAMRIRLGKLAGIY